MKTLRASIAIGLIAFGPVLVQAQENRPAPRPADLPGAGGQLSPALAFPPEKPGNPPPSEQPAKPQGELPPADAPAPPQGTTPETGLPPSPSGAAVHATLREDDFSYSSCLLELTLLGADYAKLPPLTDPDHPDCGIDRPIRLQAPLPGVEIAGGAVMRCDTARHLAHWLRDFVRPAAALLPGQPRLTGIEPGSTYQCRPTVGNGGEKLSEHAFGNAFDIAAFRFQGGPRIEIAPRQDDGDLTESFQSAVRATACLHFTTVLGPGANAAHENHLHLDIKARKGGYRLCQ